MNKLPLILRKATQSDFHQLKELLKQLTVVGNPTSVDPDIYNNIYLILYDEKIVACATLLIENKIIHDGGKVGHIEDVTVDQTYRNQGLGKMLIDHCVKIGRENGCYKVILDCDDDNVKFYEKCGFKARGICMRIDI